MRSLNGFCKISAYSALPWSWFPGLGLPRGCASSQVDQGLKVKLSNPPNLLKSKLLAVLAAPNYAKSLKIELSTRIKDAGIAIRHSRGYIISVLQGPERVGSGGTRREMDQFRSKITKIRVSTLRMSGIRIFSRRRPMPACSPVSFKQSRILFCDICPR